MDQNNSNQEKVFFAFGIITIISGIYLVFDSQYIIGISGTIVGIWLTLDNWKKLRMAKNG